MKSALAIFKDWREVAASLASATISFYLESTESPLALKKRRRHLFYVSI